MDIQTIIITLLLTLNLIAFCLYARDKRAARTAKPRTRESTLLWWSLPGPFGALLAMQLLRHKTQHKKFTLLVPAFCFLQLAALGWYIVSR